jgi:hypothetical protein
MESHGYGETDKKDGKKNDACWCWIAPREENARG